MSQNPQPVPQPHQQTGLFRWVWNRVQLVLRLLFDERVKPYNKLLPVLGTVFLFVPLLGGFLARAGAFLVMMFLFVESSPHPVVREHLEDIYRPLGEERLEKKPKEDVVIDAVAYEVDEENRADKKGHEEEHHSKG